MAQVFVLRSGVSASRFVLLALTFCSQKIDLMVNFIQDAIHSYRRTIPMKLQVSLVKGQVVWQRWGAGKKVGRRKVLWLRVVVRICVLFRSVLALRGSLMTLFDLLLFGDVCGLV